MKIRKSAWHFKLYDFSFDGPGYVTPTNLCPYFWRVVGGTLKGLMIGGLLLAVLIVVGYSIYQYPLTFLAAVSSIAIIITIGYNMSRIRGFLTRDLGEGEVPEPGLLRAFLKAKKDKVCPLIELVEE